jgi:hypothetical protein
MEIDSVLTGIPRQQFEVTVTVPREDGGELLVPRVSHPPGVMAVCTAKLAQAVMTVHAVRKSAALAIAGALVPELAEASGAIAEVRPLPA